MDLPLEIVNEAPQRWFQTEELESILKNYNRFELSENTPDRPLAGSLFLYNRNLKKSLTNDGYAWKKESDGVSVCEKVKNLKINGAIVIRFYIARGEFNEKFERRRYWLSEQSIPEEDVVLVHYRDTEGCKEFEIQKLSLNSNGKSYYLRRESVREMDSIMEETLCLRVYEEPVKEKKEIKQSRAERKQQRVFKKKKAPLKEPSQCFDCIVCDHIIHSKEEYRQHFDETHALEFEDEVEILREQMELHISNTQAAPPSSSGYCADEQPTTSGRE